MINRIFALRASVATLKNRMQAYVAQGPHGDHLLLDIDDVLQLENNNRQHDECLNDGLCGNDMLFTSMLAYYLSNLKSFVLTPNYIRSYKP
jgi:hypothetical protein